ncbi:cytochrome P450 [Eremomyces bilateralis CBS 781.70]|uniref:Cytochrome P450 n=1 Tax=Eremomyces bilateralis CBS 781.70 TaxID=1392243 RepID=A0A6G1GG43_9PEZI|nr:cytochrome P450 [Eremomyces bilateralis CBS 781.70]KAF1817023.1 cytochrome P450 [Eremomyces bilateralis CBS 781.70]
MASGKLPLLIGSSLIESLAIITFLPQYLPANPLVWTLSRVLAVNSGILLVYLIFIYPFYISPLRHLPSPGNGIPIIGLGAAMFKRPPGQDFLNWVTNVPNDGLILFRGLFHRNILLLTNPRTIGEVLVTKSYEFQKPTKVRNFLRRILGDGLIIVEGDEHRFQRKHIMPVFSFRNIKELYPMIWGKSVALTQALKAELEHGKSASTGELELNHWANNVTMDIIGVAGLGRDFNALKNSDDPLIQNYEEILEPTAEKVAFFACQIILPQWFIEMLPWGLNERVKVTTTNLTNICLQLVRDKREAIKMGGEEHFDILSILIKSDNFSDKQLVDQLLTFLAAGHETTSSTFTWTAFLLAKYPHIQTRLREEVRAYLPADPSNEPNLAQILESMPLLNGVCNETLRLYPTVPITVRAAVRDTTVMDLPVPKDTELVLCPWAVNRSPHLWGKNASEFVPERWIDFDAGAEKEGRPNNTGGAKSNYAQLTFLHGPRSCIGQNFAKAELRALTAALVGAFEWTLANQSENVIPGGVITTKPQNGMHLKLKPIADW